MIAYKNRRFIRNHIFGPENGATAKEQPQNSLYCRQEGVLGGVFQMIHTATSDSLDPRHRHGRPLNLEDPVRQARYFRPIVADKKNGLIV